MLDLPVATFPAKPVSPATAKEQINSVTTVTTIIPVLGSIVNQLTGTYVNGINTLYPVSSGGSPGDFQAGFTGVLGGDGTLLPGNGPAAFGGGFTGTIGG